MTALILSIETATPICSVAIHEDGKLLGVKETEVEKSHAKLLTIYIEELLTELGIQRTELDALAVSMGPGSYTGLRIGVSTVKGLAYALDLPVIGVDTLSALAHGASNSNASCDFIIPMIDARRMEVYQAVFDKTLSQLEPVSPHIFDGDSYVELIEKGDVLMCGDGSTKAKLLFENNKNVLVLDDVLPSARWIGKIAFDKFELKEFEDVAYFEPFYLKEAHTTVSKKQPLKT